MFLFLESVFLFLEHQTCKSVIDRLFEWEKIHSLRADVMSNVSELTWIHYLELIPSSANEKSLVNLAENHNLEYISDWIHLKALKKMSKSLRRMCSVDNLQCVQKTDLSHGSMMIECRDGEEWFCLAAKELGCDRDYKGDEGFYRTDEKRDDEGEHDWNALKTCVKSQKQLSFEVLHDHTARKFFGMNEWVGYDVIAWEW